MMRVYLTCGNQHVFGTTPRSLRAQKIMTGLGCLVLSHSFLDFALKEVFLRTSKKSTPQKPERLAFHDCGHDRAQIELHMDRVIKGWA